MFLGRVSGWTSTTGTAIPFSTVKNTNDKISNNSGVISLNRSGIWNIDASLVVSGYVGTVIANVYADGVATGSFAETTLEASEFGSLSLTDAVSTVLASYPNVADISIQISPSSVTTSGTIRVEYVK